MKGLVPTERLTRGPTVAARRKAAGEPEVDARALARRLRASVKGEVRFDDTSRGLYAQDGSNYYHLPLGVVLPRSAEDVVATVAACRAEGAPVVARTGGTSLAGQTCNRALVLDFSKYMREILEVDPEARLARVQPGVVCDELTRAVKRYDLTWGPKPATHSRCGFGGMLSNNCGGMHAHYAGIAVHNVEALEVLLYDGTRMHLGWTTEDELDLRIRRGGREGQVLAELRALRDRYAARIQAGYPKLPRRVSGYNLDELLPKADGRINLARAIVGTEGTCVTILEATIRLVDLRPQRVLVMLGYEDVFRAADHVPDVLTAVPDAMAVEGMDQRLYDKIRQKGSRSARSLDLLPGGHGWLLVQIGSSSKEGSIARGQEVVEALRARAVDAKVVTSDSEQKSFWNMREDSLGATAFVPGQKDTWEGWEDSAVPPHHLGAYLRDLDALYRRYGYSSVLYGHFGQGLVHCRVDFDLASKEGIGKFHAFLDDASTLVARKYGGSLSGEHGDGQSKAEFLTKMYGPELVRAFEEFKAIWDPEDKMNPGKIVRPRRADEDLRLGPAYDPAAPPTHFQFPADGGSFARATLRCVGVGKCRNLDSEEGTVMCPSYMVTKEEKHSTRGRAHLLWEMLRGQGQRARAGDEGPAHGGFRDEGVKESLSLCLACKGCKTDCPVNVDVATYKAEFLSHYYAGRLRPRHAFAFGLIDRWARLASLAPGLVNLVTQARGTRALAKLAAGVHQARTLPTFAPQSFRSWFVSRGPQPARPHEVLLWVDTFNDHFHPGVAKAAVKVLEHLGFGVRIPSRPVCCGRPLYDFGTLHRAKAYLEDTLACIAPSIDAGLQMVVLEPSCASVFRDELPELLAGREEARRVKEQTVTLSELLARRVPREKIPRLRRRAVVQVHCHHHAVVGFEDEATVLDAMGLDHEELRSGCCGMAGSFGFVSETHDVGQAAGERVLLPRVRAEEGTTVILADGFSCKTQVAQHTARRALHLAEALALAIDEGEAGPTGGPFVESALTVAEADVVRRSTRRAALAIAVTLGSLLTAWTLGLLTRRLTR